MIKKLLVVNLIIFSCLIFADLTAYTSSSTPPASHTGAPGESTCVACHSGSLNSGSGDVLITFGDGATTTYKLDSVYTITVQTSDLSKIRFGFELTALTTGNDSVGTFILTNNTNTAIQTASVSGKVRKYVSHKNAGSNNTWQFKWRAPHVNKGNIKFYAAGNATNNDFSTTGDLVYTSTVELSPAVIAATGSPYNSFDLSISPNHSNGIRLNYTLEEPSDIQINLYDLNGRAFYQAAEQQEAGKQAYVIDRYLIPGFYFVSLRSGTRSAVQKIIVQ